METTPRGPTPRGAGPFVDAAVEQVLDGDRADGLRVDADSLAVVASTLEEGAERIGASPLLSADPLAVTAFGASELGARLGLSHDRARTVVTDVLGTFSEDLHGFAGGVTRAVEMVAEADETARAELAAHRRAAEVLRTTLAHAATLGERA